MVTTTENLKYTNNHRFTLTRKWIGTGTRLNWIMLNPSTADETQDDPTIRKCRGFAQRWGFSEMIVTNLFAFRATDPQDLRAMAKLDYARAVGWNNDGAIIEAAKSSTMVIAAWGLHGSLCGRAEDVMERVLPETNFYCINRTRDGFPLHPCMAAYVNGPILFHAGLR